MKTYNPDFGDNIYEQFTVNFALPVEEVKPLEIGDLAIYPNPSSKIVNAVFSLPVYAHAKLRILNLVGQVIQEENVVVSQPREKVTLDISNLSNGLYYVVLESGSFKKMQKLVVNR